MTSETSLRATFENMIRIRPNSPKAMLMNDRIVGSIPKNMNSSIICTIIFMFHNSCTISTGPLEAAT